jgi:hypothetical protein
VFITAQNIVTRKPATIEGRTCRGTQEQQVAAGLSGSSPDDLAGRIHYVQIDDARLNRRTIRAYNSG